MVTIPTHTRELFTNLVRREVRGRYKGSALGVVWTLVTPFIMMLAYTLVFSVLFQFVDERLPNYPLYLLTGLALWLFFAGALNVSATSLIANANLVKKVRFPRFIVPVAAVVSQSLTMIVMIAVLIPFSVFLMPGDPVVMLLLPVIMIPIVMMVVGAALAVSVLNVYFRDIEHIIAALLLPWFFLTPVLFSFDTFPLATEHVWLVDVLQLVNFVTPFMIAFQDVLYWGLVPGWRIWTYIFVVGPAMLLGGHLIFRRMQRNLAVEL
jgi:ABC-type polysaccharide/polyol phosphate export permease